MKTLATRKSYCCDKRAMPSSTQAGHGAGWCHPCSSNPGRFAYRRERIFATGPETYALCFVCANRTSVAPAFNKMSLTRSHLPVRQTPRRPARITKSLRRHGITGMYKIFRCADRQVIHHSSPPGIMPLAMMSPTASPAFLPSQSWLTEPAPRAASATAYRYFGGHAEHTFRSGEQRQQSKPGESSASDPSVSASPSSVALQFSAGYVRSDHISGSGRPGIFRHIAAN